jgi:hypothetical protein
MRRKKFSVMQKIQFSLLMASAAASPSLLAQDSSPKLLWQLDLDERLQGRIYETLLLPGDVPRLLATTSDDVYVIEAGKPSALFRLQHSGSIGQSAILPPVYSEEPDKQPYVGVLNHNHHAVESFQFVDLSGNVIFKLDDPRHFYYRLSPAGNTYVGIDSGNVHTALAADKVVYRFYDAADRNREAVEVVSERPSLSFDSAYSPDGKLFFINSRKTGLTAYDPLRGSSLWSTQRPAKQFVGAANAAVLAVDDEARHVATLWLAGKAAQAFDLHELGIKENVRSLAISPNGRYAVVTGRQQAVLIDVAAAKTRLFPVSQGFAINSSAVNDAGVVALGAQSEDLSQGELRLVDISNGDINAKPINFKHRHSNAWIPIVRFEGSGRYLTVRTLDEIQLYGVGSL